MRRSLQHPGLNGFAWLTAGATLVLIGVGGLVTSKGAGMAVPDWPTTYGYNMFLFPIRLWAPGTGIFYEHSHRLFASFVGLLTTILAVWLWVSDSRRWLRWLGIGALAAVIVQGLLGGLRVTLFKDEIGIVHAALAQAFLVLVTMIALFASGRGDRLIAAFRGLGVSPGLRQLMVGATFLIFAQLILGASMRHQHAGLAVPDFPLAYGQLWPPMDAAFIDQVNRQRVGLIEYRPITAFHIGLHMAHRIGAVAILLVVILAAWKARREHDRGTLVRRLMGIWTGLIVLQAVLGAVTVWSNKAADIATAHVLLGAVSLVWGAVLSVSAVRAASWGGSRAPALSPLTEPSLGQAKPTIS